MFTSGTEANPKGVMVDADTGALRKPGEEGELQVRTSALFAGDTRTPPHP
jgi:acyl-CoA synthetase (AMP-forming)/AMP-acid ligase II